MAERERRKEGWEGQSWRKRREWGGNASQLVSYQYYIFVSFLPLSIFLSFFGFFFEASLGSFLQVRYFMHEESLPAATAAEGISVSRSLAGACVERARHRLLSLSPFLSLLHFSCSPSYPIHVPFLSPLHTTLLFFVRSPFYSLSLAMILHSPYPVFFFHYKDFCKWTRSPLNVFFRFIRSAFPRLLGFLAMALATFEVESPSRNQNTLFH